MRQKDLDYLVIVGLLLSGLYVATTGLIMDLYDSSRFLWHTYAGYISFLLVGVHVVLNWGRVAAYLRRRFGGRPGREWPTGPWHIPLVGRREFLLTAIAAAGGFALGRILKLPGEIPRQLTTEDLGQLYHQWSKLGYVLMSQLGWGQQPTRYKTYPGASVVALPDPHGYRGLDLEAAIEQRRSRRDYRAEPLSLEQLSGLLHAASGLTDPVRELRAAPSAGALYPVETYVIVHQVTGLTPGIYHYAVAEHSLEQIQAGDLRSQIIVAGIGQEMLAQAPVCFVLSAVFQRARWKYQQRAYRYILLEAGHIGQNLYLAATSMGLGACAVGAFLDDNLNDLLGLDGQEEGALYIITVGKV